MEDLLTAETLQEYLQEEGVDARLLHSADGELVAVATDELQIMFAFRESPRFDIRKKQKGGWGMKKLIRRYNENKAGLTFIYDENEEELIGSAEFSLSISPEDLIHKCIRQPAFILDIKIRKRNEPGTYCHYRFVFWFCSVFDTVYFLGTADAGCSTRI